MFAVHPTQVDVSSGSGQQVPLAEEAHFVGQGSLLARIA
jgi:hypothetical protein